MYTVHNRKSYSLRKTEFISRVGFGPSASAAGAPLANIIRFMTDQQLSRTTVDEYRTRFITNEYVSSRYPNSLSRNLELVVANMPLSLSQYPKYR